MFYSDKPMCIPRDHPIAVYYNFKSGLLGLRGITPEGGLGRVIGRADRIVLRDVEFTSDPQKIENWREGNVHARQFAEARGVYVESGEFDESRAEALLFAPDLRDDFHTVDGRTVLRSPRVLLETVGREPNILAYPQEDGLKIT
jgi:hypothetical protein